MIRIVCLILILIQFIEHVGCNQPYVNESNRITSPWNYQYLFTFFDVSDDFMVIGTRNYNNFFSWGANITIYTLVDDKWEFSYATSVDKALNGVAIDGNEIAVLTYTSLSIFVGDYGHGGGLEWNSTWENDTVLPLPKINVTDQNSDKFSSVPNSCCVEMENGTIVLGTSSLSLSPSKETYLNIFTRKNGLWNISQLIHLEPCINEPLISMSHNLIAVSCYLFDYEVFIFKREQDKWIQHSRLQPANLNSYIVSSITLYGDVLALCVLSILDSQSQGTIIYRLLNGTWKKEIQIDTTGGGYTSGDVSISQTHLLTITSHHENPYASRLRIYRYQNGSWEHRVDLRNYWSGDYPKGIIRKGDVFITAQYCSSCQMSVYSYFDVASTSKESKTLLNSTEQPSERPKIHSPTLKCDELNMTTYWTKTTFRGDNITVTIKDGSCNNLPTLENSTTIWLTIPFFECGSSVIENDVTIVIRNTAVVHATRTHNDVIVRKDMTFYFNFECVYQRDVFVSTHPGYEINYRSTVTYNKSSLGYVKASMSMFETSFFDQKLTYPIKVTLDEAIHVGVNIQRNPNVKMVVQRCFATASPELSSESYVFFTDRCSLDDTFEVTAQTNHQFRFSINAFRFLRVKRAVFLHCAVLICQHNSTLRECQQKCTSRVRRDAIHKSASEVNNLQYVTSGKIIYERKQTCANIASNCPINSDCVDMYPPVCRCNDGFVKSEEDGLCKTKRMIKMKKLHIDTEWNDEFHNPLSKTFIQFAIIMEAKLFHFFVKVLKIIEIVGIHIDGAEPGSVYLDFSLIYAKNSSSKHVTKSILRKLENTNTTSTEIQDIKIILDTLPIIDQVENNDDMNMQLVVTISVPVVLLSVIAVFVFAKRYRKENKDAPDGDVPKSIELTVNQTFA